MVSTALVAGKLIFFGFQCVVPLLVVGGFVIIISSLILQDACTQCRAEPCCISNIFPNLCSHQACAVVLKALENFHVLLWMTFEFIFG